LLEGIPNSVSDWFLCPSYSRYSCPEVFLPVLGVTARRPAARSTCSTGILYVCRVADCQRVSADSNWLDDGDAILAHSRYADGMETMTSL